MKKLQELLIEADNYLNEDKYIYADNQMKEIFSIVVAKAKEIIAVPKNQALVDFIIAELQGAISSLNRVKPIEAIENLDNKSKDDNFEKSDFNNEKEISKNNSLADLKDSNKVEVEREKQDSEKNIKDKKTLSKTGIVYKNSYLLVLSCIFLGTLLISRKQNK